MTQGIAFGDHIKTGKIKRYKHGSEEDLKMRTPFLFILLLLVVGVLSLRLLVLQVASASYYRHLSDGNRTRTLIIHAPRGVILDRYDRPLVYNVPGFRKVSEDKVELIQREEALARIAKGEKGIEIDTLRNYPYKEAFSHVLGYVGQIDAESLKEMQYKDYLVNDVIGKSGLEEMYETQLKGQDGKELIEVDALGKKIKTLGMSDPLSGKEVQTTLDRDLQLVVYDALKDVEKGAVIVSTPKGEILSLVSKPSFDSNLFTMGNSYKVAGDSPYQEVSQILLDGNTQPLLNRAISGVYPPASTFKLIAAAAGLESKVIDENYGIEDTGIVRIGEFSFGNWYFLQYGRKEEGKVDVIRAIARSNDIFFYKLAELLHIDGISEVAQKFGVGVKLGIDLPGEVSGTLPTREWKQRVMKEQWYTGDTYHYGIGQGYLLTTPLQVNAWTQAVANKGMLYRPHLLSDERQQKVLSKDLMTDKTYSLIKQGMIAACEEGGTAYPLFDFSVKNSNLKIDNVDIFPSKKASNSAEMKHIQVACKTGTGQHGGDETLPHAWITLFAPVANPEVVITVLSEASGEGSTVAAPVAKKILEAWFGNK